LLTEIAWAAGFYDGEGCVSSTGTGVQVIVGQSSSDGVPEVLERLRAAVDLGKINGPYYREGQQPHYRWTLGRREDVRTFFTLLWPYLSGPKKQQALRRGVNPQIGDGN
jgi:hypothetical protein